MPRIPPHDHSIRRTPSRRPAERRDRLVGFLVERLTDDLAQLWARDQQRPARRRRPGLASQLAVLDEQLLTLRAGRLPDRSTLRVLLYCYGSHPDYDPAWTDQLLG